ncbi:MAG: hypothetical protein GX111_09220 [Clostridiales bacterium]|nr:hypothetical protein [Clostridiales bacterium]
MANIHVRFENRDMADIAMSRLRRKGIAYKISESVTEGSSGHNEKVPFAPQYVANLLFPFAPPNVATNSNINDYNLGQASTNFGSRAVLGADSIGLPYYGANGEVHLRFVVNDANRDNTRMILRNSGGFDIK